MPAPRSLGHDFGLQARLLLTLCLLGLVYVSLITVLIAAGVGAGAVAAIAGALFLVQYFTSDRLALASMAAHEVSDVQAPELHAIVERLSLQFDLPMPRLAVCDTPMPSALAVGRSPATATVCTTTGLLDLLNRSELEGVLAHELSHIRNRDVMLMTVAGFFASIAAFIVQMGFWLGAGVRGGSDHSSDHGNDHRNDHRNDHKDTQPSAIVVVLAAGLVYVVSFVLLQALSRYREFSADRGSAIITGRPGALCSALTKISGQMEQIPQRDLRAASGELAAFYIFPPTTTDTVATLFSTHPSLTQRLDALSKLESQLPGAAAGAR